MNRPDVEAIAGRHKLRDELRAKMSPYTSPSKSHADRRELLTYVSELEAEVARLKGQIHEAVEVYAGMEGFEPETAPEGYCLRILRQIVEALKP